MQWHTGEQYGVFMTLLFFFDLNVLYINCWSFVCLLSDSGHPRHDFFAWLLITYGMILNWLHAKTSLSGSELDTSNCHCDLSRMWLFTSFVKQSESTCVCGGGVTPKHKTWPEIQIDCGSHSFIMPVLGLHMFLLGVSVGYCNNYDGWFF